MLNRKSFNKIIKEMKKLISLKKRRKFEVKSKLKFDKFIHFVVISFKYFIFEVIHLQQVLI